CGGEAFDEHRRLWPRLEEESSIDFQGRMMSHLEVVLDEEGVPPLQGEMERWDATDGFSARWLEGKDVRALDSRLADEVLGGVLLESLGMVDSQLLTRALIDVACRRGARVVEERAVGITWSGDRAVGVRTASGEVASQAVAIATGPWARSMGEWLGFDLPVTPLKGQIVRLEGLTPPLEYHVAGPGAVVQKADGKLWAAATEECVGFDLSTTSEAKQDLIERASRVLPTVTQARILEQTACLRPRTPDDLPILGAVPNREDVYLVSGGGKKGVLLAPAMGRVLADLVVREATKLPIDEFAPGRFAGIN
ncbi:MAG: FAD-dependent oxidoreductase, partial [Chloroflexi bacterium]|nr:FAD-dependent oxidoreductase [Chloroflexota bacterium]